MDFFVLFFIEENKITDLLDFALIYQAFYNCIIVVTL